MGAVAEALRSTRRFLGDDADVSLSTSLAEACDFDLTLIEQAEIAVLDEATDFGYGAVPFDVLPTVMDEDDLLALFEGAAARAD